MIKLYTTGCPQCKFVEAQFNNKQIVYEKITDKEIMLQKQFTHVPMLELEDGRILNYKEIIKWINEAN